jgi:hypothetical protein
MSEETPGFRLRAVTDAPARGPVQMITPEPEVGQIWVAHSDDGEHVLVLLTEVHDDHVQVVLCTHEQHDLVAETDVVLEASATGCPYCVLIHGDVAGRVLKDRLDATPGRVHRSIVRRILLRGYGFDFHSSDLGRGAPIVSDSDPRWAWKQERQRELRTVQARAADLGWGIYKLGEPGGEGEDTEGEGGD